MSLPSPGRKSFPAFTPRANTRKQDRNIILTSAFEYRLPSHPVPDSTPLTSRYLGQVVVPGPHITRIQVDEFASQVSGGGGAAAAAAAAGGGSEEGG
jgi:hypothetical protein